MSMTKALGDAVGAIGKLNGSMLKMTPATLGLKVAVEGLKAAMNVTAKYAERNLQINERLLVLGTNQIDFFQENKEALLKNTASIDDQMRVATEMRAAGFEQFNKEQVNLAANMKMTGQNTKAAIDLFASLEKNTLLTTSQQENLAKTINDTALAYGRAAESIVAAVEKLNTDAMTKFGLNAEALNELVIGISGPNQMAGELTTDFINTLITAAQGEGGMASLAFTEILPEFERVMRGEGSESDIRAMVDSITANFGSVVDGMPAAIRMGMQDQIPGQEILLAAQKLQDQFGRQERGVVDDTMLDTLAAEKARASREIEVNAATITGFRELKELSILGNAFLENIAVEIGGDLMDGIGSMGKSIASFFGLQGDYYASDKESQESIASSARQQLLLQQSAAAEAQAARLAQLEAGESNRITNRMMMEQLNFSPGTALYDVMDSVRASLEGTGIIIEEIRREAARRRAEEAMERL